MTPGHLRGVFFSYLAISLSLWYDRKKRFASPGRARRICTKEGFLMKNEKARRIAGAVMLGAALLFFIYALNHPEGSFAMENSTTYLLYLVFLVVALLLVLAPKKKR